MSNLTGVQFIFIIMIVIVLVPALYNIYLLGKLKSGKKDRPPVEAVKHSDNSIRENVEEPAEDINKINSILMERAIELGSINQLSEKINSTLDPDEVIQSACDELVKIFPVESAGIALLDRDKKKLITKVFKTGAAGRTDDIEAELDLANNKLFSDVINSRRPAVIETEAAPNEKRSVLIVPVISSMETMGIIILPASEPGYNFNKSEIDLARTIAIQIAGSAENARLFSRNRKALKIAENDLEIGRQIQSDFFPETPAEMDNWEICTHFKAARQVSGDFYDVFRLRNSKYTVFIIGDVCDKGVGAALFMVLFRSLLRAYSLQENEITQIESFVKHIILNTNNYIAETHSNSNMFAALFFGVLDIENNMIYYINGGLEAPVVTRSDGSIINRLLPTGPVVGMFPGMEFKVSTLSLNPGESLFVYTDGTTDAKNSSGGLFGEESLLSLLSSASSSGFSRLFDLNSQIDKHIGQNEQYDDITQLVLRRKISPGENRHSVTRKAVISNLKEMRKFVEKSAEHCGLDKETVFSFKLVTEEICTNIIKYSFDGEDPGYILIEFEKENEKAVLRIYDDGKQFVPDTAVTTDINTGWINRKVGGLGITLVRELMDRVDYYRDPGNRNCTVIEKNIK